MTATRRGPPMAPALHEPAVLAPVTRLTLTELSARTGVPVSTIHHYRARGVLPPPSEPGVTTTRSHVRALRLVRLLRERRGLSARRHRRHPPGAPRRTSTRPSSRPCGTASSRSRPTDDPVRAALVDGTLAELARRSLDELTVADLCAAAGVGKSTFYRYFDSKEAAFLAAADAAADRVAEALGASPDQEPLEFAGRLRDVLAPVLPVLLELAMRASRGAPSFADRRRQRLRPHRDDDRGPPEAGGNGVTALAQAATELVTAVFDSVS